MKTGIELPFKVHPAWDCKKSFYELVEDAKFIFKLEGMGIGPTIVLIHPIDGSDTIEIRWDNPNGVYVKSYGRFNDFEGRHIDDSSKDIIGFIAAEIDRLRSL